MYLLFNLVPAPSRFHLAEACGILPCNRFHGARPRLSPPHTTPPEGAMSTIHLSPAICNRHGDMAAYSSAAWLNVHCNSSGTGRNNENTGRRRSVIASIDPAGMWRKQLQDDASMHPQQDTEAVCLPHGITHVAMGTVPSERLRNAMELIQQTQHSVATNPCGRALIRHHSPRTLLQHLKTAVYLCESRRQVFPQGLGDRLQRTPTYSTRTRTVRIETRSRTTGDSPRYHAAVAASHGTTLANGDD